MTHAQSRRTVLIVDDEPTLVELLAFVLGRESYQVTTACCGNTAFDLIQAQSFDFIVCDYLMPGMDGLQLCQALRARGDNTFFVLMTAMPLDSMRAAYPACNAYLQKPFAIDALLAAVK